MEEEMYGRNGFCVAPQSQLSSYVVTITLPQPSITFKVPRVLVKAVHGGNNMKKYWDLSKRRVGKKVGSMFSKVLGSPKVQGNVKADQGGNGFTSTTMGTKGKLNCLGSSHGHWRMLKSAWRMGRKAEKQQLCNRKILMGKKCRPLE